MNKKLTDIKEEIKHAERRVVLKYLKNADGNLRKASWDSGIPYNTLIYKIKSLGLFTESQRIRAEAQLRMAKKAEPFILPPVENDRANIRLGLIRLLKQHKGNLAKTARAMGMSYSALNHHIRALGLLEQSRIIRAKAQLEEGE